MPYAASLIGQGTKKIADAIGHGNLRSLQILQIAELFANHSPSSEMRKTESNPSIDLGFEFKISIPSVLF
tara:strand:- start:454 stop:663 length:210 start_codon:yes stop_codon:yes gene_type:complete